MTVLLINPGSTQVDKSWAYRKFFTPIPPLGLAYLAAVLEKDGFRVLVHDQFACKSADRELLRIVAEERPSVVGFGALTPVMPDASRAAVRIKAAFPAVKIAAGNIHPTCFPEDVLSGGSADVVVRGEGEISMLELCRRVRDGGGWEGVGGISFRTADGRIVHNPDREVIADLNSLPFPAWHLFDPDRYTRAPLLGIRNMRAFPVLASRGCDYRCYYCSQDKLYKQVRYRQMRLVVEEMEYFHRAMGIGFFGFCDAYFPFNEESGLIFCELLMRRGLQKKIKWSTETRVDKVTPRLLKTMKRAGAHLIMYGIEVGDAAVLNAVNKRASLPEAEFALRETRRAGILSQGLFILGLPGETEQTCRRTMRFAARLDPDFAKFNLAMPYPGSRFYDDYRRSFGAGAPEHPERFSSWYDWTGDSGELIYTPAGMDGNTLRRLQREAMFGYYMRPRVVIRHILKGTIGLKDFFFGALWLFSLLLKGDRSGPGFGKIKKREGSDVQKK